MVLKRQDFQATRLNMTISYTPSILILELSFTFRQRHVDSVTEIMEPKIYLSLSKLYHRNLDWLRQNSLNHLLSSS